MGEYVPRKGHFIALTFDPQSGHEQRGRRPALVVSNGIFNKHTGLCIVCPVISTRRGYPFHVEVPEGHAVTGFVMVEQVKCVDFRAREAAFIGKAPGQILEEVLSILDTCIY